VPFYFKKSISTGPIRFNFSKGGIGVSVGIKGFRVGTGPRGHYVQAGREGFYYRTSLGGSSTRHANRHVNNVSNQQPSLQILRSDDMIEVTSSDVLSMRESAFADVLDDLNKKHSQTRLSMIFLWCSVILLALILVKVGNPATPLILLAPVAWFIGNWLDSFKRTVVLFYDLKDDTQQQFMVVCKAFDNLADCAGAWHIEAGKAVQDLTTWKRQAGASHLVRRNVMRLNYQLPEILKCNITPPAFSMGARTIYLLPDVALIHDIQGFGAVGYDALHVAVQHSNFIETEGVPHDAEISSYTWEHPNKSGEPDLRFKDNRRLPVCCYETMHLTSPSGINELFEFSRRGFVLPLAAAFNAMPRNKKIISALKLK